MYRERMPPRVFASIADLQTAVGSHLGHSDWWEISQERVNRFADATDDHQYIHVDPERAAFTPFGGPIAHGYLTLSMAVAFVRQILEVEGIRLVVNYGLNRVRFPAPVPVGSQLRAGAELAAVEEIEGGAQVLLALTFEVEAGDRPVCVAEAVFRYYV